MALNNSLIIIGSKEKDDGTISDPYLSSVGNRESVVVVAVDKSYSFFCFQHMIVEPVLFVCPAADVIIARRRLYSEAPLI